ncbi:MAG: nucleotidyltransferase domain-containing protein [Thermoplasmata archaeon]|nr:nucleotidyltransferase domain-containing protein [Thermoplasmata archaeon]
MIDMKLHNPLDGIMDSKSKVRILRLLFRFPGRDFTEREIASMINMSPNTVNLALNDLRRTNVFIYKRIGRTHAYHCNQGSALFPLFTALFEREGKIWLELLDYLRMGLAGVGTSILFGSFARSEESYDSDLDILIIAKNKKLAESRLSEVSERVLSEFSVTIAPMIMTRSEFEIKKRKGFIKQALSEGIIIVKDGSES